MAFAVKRIGERVGIDGDSKGLTDNVVEDYLTRAVTSTVCSQNARFARATTLGRCSVSCKARGEDVGRYLPRFDVSGDVNGVRRRSWPAVSFSAGCTGTVQVVLLNELYKSVQL